MESEWSNSSLENLLSNQESGFFSGITGLNCNCNYQEAVSQRYASSKTNDVLMS
jgi:hypothetical protein